MTIKELIEKLNKFPLDTKVQYADDSGYADDFNLNDYGDGTVVIEVREVE